MNPALDDAEKRRKDAMDEVAKAPEPLPVAPAAPQLPPPVETKSPYGPGLTDADLAKAYEDKRSADNLAQVFNAGAALSHAVGGKTPLNAGDAFKSGEEDKLKEILARRAGLDQEFKATEEREAKSNVGKDARFKQFLLGQMPETKDVAAQLGPRLQEVPADQLPGMLDLLKEHAATIKAHTETAGLLAMLPFIQKQYGYSDDDMAQFKAALMAGMKGPTFRGFVQPSYSTGFDPTTGTPYKTERKTGVVTGRTIPGVPTPPAGVTPKDAAQRRKDVQENQPPMDFEFNEDIARGDRPVPGGKALQKETASQVAFSSTALDLSKKLNEILDRNPNGTLAGKDASEAEKYQQELLAAVRQAQHLGVYRPGEQPMLDKLVADITDWKNIVKNAVGWRDMKTSLTAGQGALRQRAASMAQQAGWHPSPYGKQSGRWEGQEFPSVPGLDTSIAVKEPAVRGDNGLQVQERKSVKGRNFVKINGDWHEE